MGKVLLSAGDQISRVEYVRFEMQVDPPPGRRLVQDIPSYAEVVSQMQKLGFKHTGQHACHFDAGASTFSREIKEMECVFCQHPPCQEGHRAPLGPHPREVQSKVANLPYLQPPPWKPSGSKQQGVGDQIESSESQPSDLEDEGSGPSATGGEEQAALTPEDSVSNAEASDDATEDSRGSEQMTPNEEAKMDEAAAEADVDAAAAPKQIYTPPEAIPPIKLWNGVAQHIPLPKTGDWMSETQFLERVLRSFGKQRIGYRGHQRMDGFQKGRIFDDDGMFAFESSIRSVAIDVGAANNPLPFDLDIDVSQVAFFVEPLQWKSLEEAIERDSGDIKRRGGCIVRWDAFCTMNRFYTFPAAVSHTLGKAKFHATANPYCGSLEAFTHDQDKHAIEDSLKNSKNPEISGIFSACYKDAGVPGDVPTISLKALLDRIPKNIAIKYVKIDAQGHDYKVLLSAGDQITRIQYVRFEMQVDPPPGRRLVKDIPSYKEVKEHLEGLGFKHGGGHACFFDHGASPFSKAVKEMECVFCRKMPCREGGVPPLGENPREVTARNKRAGMDPSGKNRKKQPSQG